MPKLLLLGKNHEPLCHSNALFQGSNGTDSIQLNEGLELGILCKDNIDTHAWITNDLEVCGFRIDALSILNNEQIISIRIIQDDEDIPVIPQGSYPHQNWLIYKNSSSENSPFEHKVGLTQFHIIIIAQSNNERKEIIFSTNYIRVFHRNSRAFKYHIQSANRMFEDIYHYSPEIGSLPISTIQSREQQLHILSLFKKICHTMDQLYPMFKSQPASSSVIQPDIGTIHEMSHMHSTTPAFLATHPQHMSVITYNTQTQYSPRQLVVDKATPCCDLTENRVILKFLAAIICELTELNQIAEINNKLPAPNLNGYIIDNSDLIQGLQNASNHEYTHLLEKFHTLLRKYEEAFGFKYHPRWIDKKKYTVTFRDIFHYHKLYQLMDMYDRMTAKQTHTDNISLALDSHWIRRLPAMDRMYEYYCLINILKQIKELGFIQISAIHFNYKAEIAKHGIADQNNHLLRLYSNISSNNTWKFRRYDNIDIIIYYQPIMHNQYNKTINGITLNRLKNDNCYSHYTPDFLISIRKNQTISNIILDAKWKTINRIQNISNGKIDIEDLYRKYVQECGIVQTKKGCLLQGHTIDGLWIFSGKNEYKTSEPDFSQNYCSGQKEYHPERLKFGYGIISLTPESVAHDHAVGLKCILENAVEHLSDESWNYSDNVSNNPRALDRYL